MTHVSARPSPTEARAAAASWRRLAARLIALVLVLVLAAPMADVDAHELVPHHSIPHLSLEMAQPAAYDGTPDREAAHHCASCACHQVVMADAFAMALPVWVTDVPSTVGEAAVTARALAPPRKPPRA